MRLDYFMPSPWARSLLTIHAVVEDVEEQRVEILPAMLPNIHFRLAGSSSVAFSGGSSRPAPPVALIGPTANAYALTLGRGCRIAIAGLLPEGWAQVMGISGRQCTELLVDGADIWGPLVAARTIERLSAAPLDGRHIGLVEAFLNRPAVSFPDLQRAQIRVIDRWLEHSPSLSLDTLSAELDVGARQLRRITLDTYGLSPKTLAMKYRALRMAALMSQGAPASDLPHVYADQSHMIRDFRRFVGWTPAAFQREPHNVAAATLSGRRRAGATRPLVLLS